MADPFRFLLPAIAGLALGATAALGYSHFYGDGLSLNALSTLLDQEKKARLAAESRDHDRQQEVDVLTSANRQLQEENQRLRKTAVAETAGTSEQGGGNPAQNAPQAPTDREKQRAEAMRSGQLRYINQRLFALKARMHLTDAQEAQLRASLEGEINGKTRTPIDELLKAIVTPEQMTEYTKMQKEERQGQTEIMAAVEMNRIAPVLGLNDQQKDQVYAAMFKFQSERSDPASSYNQQLTALRTSNPDGVQAFEAEYRKKTLSGVLSAEQLDSYLKYNQTQGGGFQRGRGGFRQGGGQ